MTPQWFMAGKVVDKEWRFWTGGAPSNFAVSHYECSSLCKNEKEVLSRIWFPEPAERLCGFSSGPSGCIDMGGSEQAPDSEFGKDLTCGL
jgi:hypothetical protein